MKAGGLASGSPVPRTAPGTLQREGSRAVKLTLSHTPLSLLFEKQPVPGESSRLATMQDADSSDPAVSTHSFSHPGSWLLNLGKKPLSRYDSYTESLPP